MLICKLVPLLISRVFSNVWGMCTLSLRQLWFPIRSSLPKSALVALLWWDSSSLSLDDSECVLLTYGSLAGSTFMSNYLSTFSSSKLWAVRLSYVPLLTMPFLILGEKKMDLSIVLPIVWNLPCPLYFNFNLSLCAWKQHFGLAAFLRIFFFKCLDL